ncbi:MAG TPA: DnaB-like helicase N-terminal domain-containing protein, partial [Anaerolineae bacterium]|nr:DnaB-like helicase N-terminal domain-containing protein [Anaerolineae bacterium]
MSELLPPFSVEAEQAVLGAMLIDPDAFFKVDVTLNAADFYVERHRWLYEAYADMVGGRRAIDFVTLCDELERRGQLNELGGAAYITELIGATPTSLNVVDYAVIVERLAVQRRLVLVGADIVQIGRKGEEEDPAAMIQAAQSKLIDATLRKGDGAITTAKDVADLYYEHV